MENFLTTLAEINDKINAFIWVKIGLVLQIAKLNDRLADQQIRCELTPAAKAAIVDAAYDPQYGARPLRRYVQHTVETMLSKRLLRGDVTPGQTVTVDAENGELVMK